MTAFSWLGAKKPEQPDRRSMSDAGIGDAGIGDAGIGHASMADAIVGFIQEHWMTGFKIGVLLLTPFLAAVLGYLVGKDKLPYALLAIALPFLPIVIEFLLRYEEYIPVVILVVAAFVPISFPTGTGSRLVLSLILTAAFSGLWILRMMVTQKRISIFPHPANLPILLFMVVVIISLAWSNLFRDPLVSVKNSFPIVQIASGLVMIMLPAAFLLTANFIKSEQTLKFLVGVMILAGIGGLIPQFSIANLPINTRGMFNLWVITLAAGIAIFHNGMAKWLRLLLFGLAGLYVYWGAVLHISWLAGWLPSLISLGIMLFMRSKKFTAIVAVALLIVVSLNFDYFYGKVFKAEEAESGETRMAAWEVNWRVTSQHLLFGTGPAGYAVYYMYYFPLEATATHSNYIDIVAQTGVVGLGLCLWFFAALAWRAFRLSLRLRGRGDFYEALANAALAGTAACIFIMAFGDWLFPFAYTQTIAGFDYAVYNWIFMGIILVVEQLTTSPTPTALEPVSA